MKNWLALLFVLTLPAWAGEPPKPTSRTAQNLAGWTIRVDDRLFAERNAALGQRELEP